MLPFERLLPTLQKNHFICCINTPLQRTSPVGCDVLCPSKDAGPGGYPTGPSARGLPGAMPLAAGAGLSHARPRADVGVCQCLPRQSAETGHGNTGSSAGSRTKAVLVLGLSAPAAAPAGPKVRGGPPAAGPLLLAWLCRRPGAAPGIQRGPRPPPLLEHPSGLPLTTASEGLPPPLLQREACFCEIKAEGVRENLPNCCWGD